ncbi:MAG: HipA domain-containing protein [Ilumatobacter sp.]|nr:HipA domain-containing protein [Ilumatobacter sp.]
MAPPDHLVVWLHGDAIADLTKADADGERLTLRYHESALDRWPANSPLLSCSLLLGSGRHDASAFVDGLLPEGDVRRRFAERKKVASHQLFDLVRHYGRDIAGAVQFLEPGAAPQDDAGEVEPLDAPLLDELVSDLDDNPFAMLDDSELSLAGVQDKMLLVALGDGRWGRPRHGRPSTHILKRDHPLMRGIVAAESDALTLARASGLTTVAARLEHHGGYDCIIVDRYDRVVEAGSVLGRIHQEDACQALGRPSTRKYETRLGGGGPELSEIADLLDRHAADPVRELDRLVATATFTALIGNADAHGKNISLLLEGGRVTLAPVYDTVPTVLWPNLNATAAMTIGGLLSLDGVTLESIEREAALWRHSKQRARAAATTCAESVLDAIGQGVIDEQSRLAVHVRRRAQRLLSA